MELEKEQIYKGTWWLPATPEKEVPGTLIISENKIELDFQGEISQNPVETTEFIQGLDLNDKPITLQHAFLIQKSIYGMSSGKFQAQTAYLGGHFAKNDDVVFDVLDVSFDNLGMWASQANLKSITQKTGAILVQYKASPDIRIKLPIYQLSIRLSASESSSLTKISLEQKASILIEPKKPTPFAEYMKIVLRLQNFFTLAMNYPTYPVSMWGMSNKGNFPTPIHLQTQDFGTRQEIFWASMLFTLRDSKQHIKPYLRTIPSPIRQ